MKNAEGRMWKAEKRTLCHVQQTLMLRIRPSQSPLPPSSSPLGLTLIELLVVIAILTTLVAGVVPVLSPNNDTRKIREAARGLQSYIMLAQANAQRTGRPAGISFTESAPGTGVALDIQPIETPPAFSGFSEYSAARIIREETSPNVFNYYVQFVLADTPTGLLPTMFPTAEDYTPDAIPPRMIRYQDEVVISGTRYRIIDEDFDGDGNVETIPEDGFYVLNNGNHSEWTFLCEPINFVGQALSFMHGIPGSDPDFWTHVFTSRARYKIHRQPIGQNTKPFASAGASFQLPRGVAIDLQASGVEGEIPGTVHVGMPNYASNPEATVLNSFDSVTGGGATDIQQDTVGIMFSPNGSVSQVFFNGNEVQNVARLFLCLGRVENGAPADYDFNGLSNQQVEEKRKEINWLALDSRWLTISTQSGNTTVSENAFVNPLIANDFDGDGNDISIDPEDQISAARDFAREQKRGGGN